MLRLVANLILLGGLIVVMGTIITAIVVGLQYLFHPQSAIIQLIFSFIALLLGAWLMKLGAGWLSNKMFPSLKK